MEYENVENNKQRYIIISSRYFKSFIVEKEIPDDKVYLFYKS